MDIEKEIEFLEMLTSIPLPPNPAPVPISRDGFVEVPKVIIDYLKKIDVVVNNPKMKTEDYATLLEQNHIPIHGISIITMRDLTAHETMQNSIKNT